MRFGDWLKREGRGVFTRLFRDTGLSYTTILAAANRTRENSIDLDTAKRLSAARGGRPGGRNG